ncbi:CgeB family protein [Methylobacterium nonmethylotrophicum]|uniref:Glycosyl transferase family 1 n=1 Tax=Methylobacterium nonmethylotrophicum TaxID=1141884 RepID=A0A4Z0NEH4_9HYPH|nr:glycosyltransferase [Methylobacterium nonmethylotrophicum]TGD94629.1 glycosyl transferase family 1 [Methylobacterium nonmethylotrophicum]
MVLKGVSPAKVLVVSTSPDAVNHNATIRDALRGGFEDVLGAPAVRASPLELAEDAVAEFGPSLVVALGSVAVDAADLRALARGVRRAGARLAFWLHDDPYEFDYAPRAEDLADHVFTNDRWALPHYRHSSVSHLPLAACRRTHDRPVRPMAQRALDLFFCGAAFPNRIALLERAQASLAARRVEVRGAGWPASLPFAENTRLTPSGMADRASAARLTLAIGRDLDIANRRFRLPASTPGPRVFEAALAGAPQLCFAAGLEILDYFEEGREILLFDDVLEIDDAIARSHREPAAFEAMAERARARALDAHTYAHRARTILAVMAA